MMEFKKWSLNSYFWFTEPLEMHSHDPKRYIGDMLAWLHQAMPEERECLNSLLKCCDNNGKKINK